MVEKNFVRWCFWPERVSSHNVRSSINLGIFGMLSVVTSHVRDDVLIEVRGPRVRVS